MPILSGGLFTAPLELAGTDDPITPVWTEDYGNLTGSWIDPDGKEWPLSDDSAGSPWFTVSGPAGWGAAPFEIVTDPLPRGGEQVRFIRAQPRRIHWPLYIGSDISHEAFTASYRQLVRAITRTATRQAPGFLKIGRGNGRYRQIACYYEEGLEGEAGENHRFAKPVVSFYCPDGYWAGDRPVVAARDFLPSGTSGSAGSTSFFSPFMTLGNSKVLTGGDNDPPTTIVNAGDVEAWPVWKIVGPMVKLTARNDTTGTRFALTYNLAAGQTITITTNRPSVRGPGDANLSRYIDWFNTSGTELWPLLDGPNDIFFQIDGAGAGTHVEMAFTPRYITA